VITVWGRRNSINVQKVLWTLGELKLPFERKNVGGSYGCTDAPPFRAMNPNGLVPVIQDDNLSMFESNAIVRYLAARYGEGSLRPKQPETLALAEQWMEWINLEVQMPGTALFMQMVRTQPSQRKPDIIATTTQALARNLPIIDTVLGRSAYIAGQELSMATFRWAALPGG
jgi:glutathione S-transferase